MTWDYQDDASSIQNLDNVFLDGNAPKLAGLLRSLINWQSSIAPRYRDAHFISTPAMWTGEWRSHDVKIHPADYNFCDDYGILDGSMREQPVPDLDFESFFYAADVLSGQLVGTVKSGSIKVQDGEFAETLVNAIEATRLKNSDDEWEDLQECFGGNSELWQNWTTESAGLARDKFDQLEHWYGVQFQSEGRQYGLFRMSELAVQFAAVIHGARVNLNSLMGETVRRVHQWDSTPSSVDLGAIWVALAGIASLAGGPATSVIAFVTAVNTMLQAAAGQGTAPAVEPEYDGCYGILTDFLKGADKIMQDTAEMVEMLVAELDRVRDDVREVPKWSN